MLDILVDPPPPIDDNCCDTNSLNLVNSFLRPSKVFISSFSLTPVFLEILDNSFMTSSGLIFFVSGFSSTLIILGFAISLAACSTKDGSINKKLFASCTFSFISSKLGSSCSFSTCLSNSSISYDSVSSQLSSIGSNCS